MERSRTEKLTGEGNSPASPVNRSHWNGQPAGACTLACCGPVTPSRTGIVANGVACGALSARAQAKVQNSAGACAGAVPTTEKLNRCAPAGRAISCAARGVAAPAHRPVEADGRWIGRTPAEFSLLPRALRPTT